MAGVVVTRASGDALSKDEYRSGRSRKRDSRRHPKSSSAVNKKPSLIMRALMGKKSKRY